MDWLIAVLWFVLGAFTGSFAACMAYRLPRRIALSGRSFCDSCGAPVGLWVYLPLLAWPLLRGRCRRCGARIPFRYWVAEFLGAAAGLWAAFRGPEAAAFGWGALFLALLAWEARLEGCGGNCEKEGFL
jgi:leader peptidase (prepilin peptidase)/N-methyltransferase